MENRMTRGTLSRISLTAAVFLLCVNSARSGEIRRLTLHISELQIIVIPPGSLGPASGASIPPQGIAVSQGKQTLLSSGTMIAQPLTQLLRIHQENRIAAAEVATSQDELKNAEDEIALEVHTLYLGILVAQLQKKAVEQETSFASESLRENEDDVRNGSTLRVMTSRRMHATVTRAVCCFSSGTSGPLAST
jgi:outer membrane protein TolC